MVSNYRKAVIEITSIVILYFLYKAIKVFDPSDSSKANPYFVKIFITYIVRAVLSLLDVTYILCFSYKLGENPIIVLSVLTDIAFYSTQLLALSSHPSIRAHIVGIDLYFLAAYGIISVGSRCKNRPIGNIQLSQAAKHYCNSRFSDFLFFEILYLIRALGPYKNNWLIWSLPIVSLYCLGLLFLAILLIFVLIGIFTKKGAGAFCFFVITLSILLLVTPIILSIYYLNDFEKTGKHRIYLIRIVQIMIFFSIINAICTIRIRRFSPEYDPSNIWRGWSQNNNNWEGWNKQGQDWTHQGWAQQGQGNLLTG